MGNGAPKGPLGFAAFVAKRRKNITHPQGVALGYEVLPRWGVLRASGDAPDVNERCKQLLMPIKRQRTRKTCMPSTAKIQLFDGECKKIAKKTTPSTPQRTALAAAHAIARESTCFVGSSCCVRTGIGQPTCFVSISQRALCLPHQFRTRDPPPCPSLEGGE